MTIVGFLPPVVQELRVSVGEGIAAWKTYGDETVATLTKTAAVAEAEAAKMERAAIQAGLAGKENAAQLETEAAAARARAGEMATAAEAASTKASMSFAGLGAASQKVFLGTSVAMAGFGYEAVKHAGDFQQAVKLLETGAGEAESNLQAVGDGMLKMAGQTGTGAKELANAMYYVESAGYHGADGLKVLSAAAQGAKTDGADAKEVADALTTVMKDMHAPASDAADVMSKMVAAVGAGKMKMADFAGSIHSVLPNASALHISFAEVGGALATMTAQGMSADQAAQNLNHTIVKLAAPTLGMTKAMASYGLSADDVAKHLGDRGLTGTMDLLVKAITDHMGPAGLTLRSAFEQSKNAAADAQRMFENLPPAAREIAAGYRDGALTLGQYRAQMKNLPADQYALVQQWKAQQDAAHGFSAALKAGGTDAQTFTAALKSMLGDQTGLQVALHLTGEAAGDFNGAVNKIKGTTADSNGHVKDFDQTMHTWNNTVAQAKAAAESFAISVGEKLLPPLTAALRFLMDHKTTTEALVGTLLGLVGVLATVGAAMKVWSAFQAISAAAAAVRDFELGTKLAAAATKAWTAAQWLLDAAMDANPIGLIIIAIAALIAGVIYAYTHFKWFHDAVNGLWTSIKAGAETVAHWAVAAWEWAGGALKSAWSALSGAWDTTVHAIESAWTWVKNAFNSTVSWFEALPDRIVGFFESLPDRIVTFFKQALAVTAYSIGYGAGTIVRVFLELGAKIWEVLSALPGQVERIFTDLWTRAKNLFIEGNTWIGVKLNELSGKFIQELQALPGQVERFFVDLWTRAKNTFLEGNAWVGVKLNELWRSVTSWISKTVTDTIKFFQQLSVDMVHWVETAVTNTLKWFEQLPSRATTYVQQLPGRIESAVSNAGSWLYNAGQQVINGLIRGVESMWSSAMSTARNFGSNLVSGFKAALGIASPSKVMAEEVGRWIPEGIAAGITRNLSTVKAAVGDLTASTTAAGAGIAVNATSTATLAATQTLSLLPTQRTAPAEEQPPLRVYLDGEDITASVRVNSLRYSGRNNTSGFDLPTGR